MRLKEFADSEQQLVLWELIRESALYAIRGQGIEQEQNYSKLEMSLKKATNIVNSPNQPKPSNPQKSESATNSAKQQKRQVWSQLVAPQILPPAFRSAAVSSAETPQQQSNTRQRMTSANALQKRPIRQRHDPNSVAITQRHLDPLPFNDVVKRLVN